MRANTNAGNSDVKTHHTLSNAKNIDDKAGSLAKGELNLRKFGSQKTIKNITLISLDETPKSELKNFNMDFGTEQFDDEVKHESLLLDDSIRKI